MSMSIPSLTFLAFREMPKSLNTHVCSRHQQQSPNSRHSRHTRQQAGAYMYAITRLEVHHWGCKGRKCHHLYVTDPTSMCCWEVAHIKLDESMRHPQQPQSVVYHMRVLRAPCCHNSMILAQIHVLARVLFRHQVSKLQKQLVRHTPSECNVQSQYNNHQHGQAAACECVCPNAACIAPCTDGLSRWRAGLGTDCRCTTPPYASHVCAYLHAYCTASCTPARLVTFQA